MPQTIANQFKLKLAAFYKYSQRYAEAMEVYFSAYEKGDPFEREAAKEALTHIAFSNAVSPNSGNNRNSRMSFAHIDARYYLGRIAETEENWLTAQEHYQIATAGKHVAAAMYHLGKLHQSDRFYQGEIVIAKDEEKEAVQYQKAAILGFELALSVLKEKASKNGLFALYLASAYGSRNIKEALNWYWHAGQQGNAEAIFRLGEIQTKSELGVIVNQTNAEKLFIRAAELGHQEALAVLKERALSPNDHILKYALGRIYENILNDKEEALQWYKKAVDHGSRDAEAMILQMAKADTEIAFKAARLYESSPDQQHIAKAFHFYAIAMQGSHAEATAYLESLAKAGNSEAQYALGYHYYAGQHKTDEAVDWCLQAAGQGHQQAWDYLCNSTFSAELYFKIAEHYAHNNIAANIKLAIPFYTKASALKHGEASFRLAEIYEAGNEADELPPDFSQALYYYGLAAEEGHQNALLKLEAFATESDDPILYCQLGNLHANIFTNMTQALKWYKRSTDLGNKDAESALLEIAAKDAPFACRAARLYEADEYGRHSLYKVFFFYALAIRNGHPEARAYLEHMAESGNATAQYVLGYEVYHDQGNAEEAVKWCMKAAEQKHVEACQYLTETQFSRELNLEIARRYEQGEGVAMNISRAIEFYLKANDATDNSLFFKMGRLYAKKSGDFEEDRNNACKFYIQAIRSGCFEALAPLRYLAETADTAIQLQVADLYRTIFNNFVEASRWEAMAGVKQPAAGPADNMMRSAHVFKPAINRNPQISGLQQQTNELMYQ